jgi:hypothetical protein
MEEKHVRKYGSQLLSALKYLHSQKVMHREYIIGVIKLKADKFIS